MSAEKPSDKAPDTGNFFKGLMEGLKDLPNFLETAMKTLQKWFEDAVSMVSGSTKSALDALKAQIDPEAKADTLDVGDTRVAGILEKNKDKQPFFDVAKKIWENIKTADPKDLEGVDKFGLWTYMTALAGQESDYKVNAGNRSSGAFGLFQIMPTNFKEWGLTSGRNAGIDEQCKVAIKQICNYYRVYDKKWEHVSVSWNAGSGLVSRYKKDPTSLDHYGEKQQNGTSTGKYTREVTHRQHKLIEGEVVTA